MIRMTRISTDKYYKKSVIIRSVLFTFVIRVLSRDKINIGVEYANHSQYTCARFHPAR
jgi:hypothetical protein